MIVKIKKLDHAHDLPLPTYTSTGSVGADLRAAVSEDLVLQPFETKLIPTGLQLSIPKGFEGQVRPRSGLAYKHNIGMLNSPGTIDWDYRGEIFVPLTNFSRTDFVIKRGDRIAQIVFARVEIARWSEVDDLDPSDRGAGGFGHSGKS